MHLPGLLHRVAEGTRFGNYLLSRHFGTCSARQLRVRRIVQPQKRIIVRSLANLGSCFKPYRQQRYAKTSVGRNRQRGLRLLTCLPGTDATKANYSKRMPTTPPRSYLEPSCAIIHNVVSLGPVEMHLLQRTPPGSLLDLTLLH